MDYEEFAQSIVEAQRKLSLSDHSKVIAEMFKSLAISKEPPYARAIIEAAGVARSMQDTLKLTFENLGLPTLADNSLVAKAAMQLAAAPIEELKLTGFFKVFPSEPQIKVLADALGTFEARFRLPDFAEAVRLIEPFQATMASSLAKYAVAMPDLKLAIGCMRTPWLDALKQDRSIEAFAELQGIGKAIRTLAPFDENLAGMLRVNLGDFREQLTWRPEVLADLQVRSEFYAGLGFNRALTDFPLRAFEETLQIAGLHPAIIPATAESSTEEEIALSRTNKAHDKLQRFERTFRRFIDKVMTETYGPKWPKQRLPEPIYKSWRDKKQTAEQEGAEARPIIEYADFTDYERLICRADNWRDVFVAFFKRPESVRESLQRLYPIRLDTMHGRLISSDDRLFLEVEIIRLITVIPNP